MATPNPEKTSLWEFSVPLYGMPGVSQACLELQEGLGVNVNLLLFVTWMSLKTGVPIAPSQLNRAIALVGNWHRDIVEPLRAVRTLMESGPAPAPSEATQLLRGQRRLNFPAGVVGYEKA